MNQLDGSALPDFLEQTLDRHERSPRSLLQILIALQHSWSFSWMRARAAPILSLCAPFYLLTI